MSRVFCKTCKNRWNGYCRVSTLEGAQLLLHPDTGAPSVKLKASKPNEPERWALYSISGNLSRCYNNCVSANADLNCKKYVECRLWFIFLQWVKTLFRSEGAPKNSTKK